MPTQLPAKAPGNLWRAMCVGVFSLFVFASTVTLADELMQGVYQAGVPAPGKLPGQSAGQGGDGRHIRSGALPPVDGSRAQYADWLFDGPTGRGFAYYLAEGYRRLAKDEDNQHDFDDAARFLARAGAVERGERVEPEMLQNRILPAYAVDDLLYARHRLMAVLERGARSSQPKLAADAQVMFDCWMEQQEENIQPQDVARCRREFEATVVRLEGPPMREAASVLPTEKKTDACPVACPPATSLYFELGKADLGNQARESLALVAQTLKAQGASGVVVSGHTDRAGGDEFNMNLSRRRLEVVVFALSELGVPGESISRAFYYGESQPRVPTPDGVRMAENRRVELRYLCGQSSAEKPVCSASAPRMEAVKP